MEFEEVGCEKIARIRETFVYFLLKHNEVVYVGQTQNGIARLAGHQMKDYDEIYVMYCEPWQLDELEDKYITKYRPKYNRQPNFVMNISLQRVKKRLREESGNDRLTIWTIRHAIKELGIEPFLIETTPYVKRDEADRIITHIINTEV